MVKKLIRPEIEYHCRECKHSHGHYSKNWKGIYILGKCPYQKYSVLLDQDCCDKFERK